MLVIPEQHIHAYAGYQIIRRNGAVVAFEPHKIAVALMRAFLAIRSNSTCRAKFQSPWLLAPQLLGQGFSTEQEQEQVLDLLRRNALPAMKSTPGNGLTRSHAGFRSCGFFSQTKVNGRNAP